ncbi:MAG: universal stress protein [Holophagaceae bacterium]
MALKNLMVHLSKSDRTAQRLEAAVGLARKHNARLVGVFGQLADAMRIGVVPSWPPESYVEAREASQAQFEAATAGLPNAEWVDVNRGSEALVTQRVVEIARCFDLVVMGQYRDPALSFAPPDLCEDVVLNSGRPVLIIPYIRTHIELGRRPMVAWTNAREAARALNDALPLIEGCEEVVLFSSVEGEENPHAEVAKHLAAHGLKCRSRIEVLDENIGVMDAMLNSISDASVDLLVMGAHTPTKRPFMNHGSGTRFILRHMTVPVLMAH